MYHAKEPNKDVWYIAPSYRMAKNIAWKKLKQRVIDLRWAEKINESELTIYLKNGSTVSLKGADNYDALRGVGLDFIVIDEFADIDPDAWFETLRPTLSDKQGKALFIGTPKGIGNWSYEMFQNSLEDPDNWSSYQYTTVDGGQVPPEEIEQAKRDLGEREFRQEYLATFETYSGRVYYSFERQHNVVDLKSPDTSIIHIGSDFNVGIMCATVAVKTSDDTLHIIDEIKIYGSNTDELVSEIQARYPRSKVFIYPDPAGAARKTSAGGRTDHTILANAGFIVKAPRRHDPVRDRINAVNSRICGSDGSRKLFVNPSCKFTIECLERQTYKEGTQQPDKDSGYDHMNDALGYCVAFMFPIKREYDIDPYSQPRTWGHRTG